MPVRTVVATQAVKANRATVLEAAGRIIRVHYLRRDGKYEGWGLHIWGDAKSETEWAQPLSAQKESSGGLVWEVELIPEHAKNNFNHWVGFQIHKGDEKDAGGDVLEIKPEVSDMWFLAGSIEIFTEQPDVTKLPLGNLAKSSAHWLEPGLLGWRVAPQAGDGSTRTYKLAYSRDARLKLSGDGLEGADGTLQLEVVGPDIPTAVRKRFPHLSGCTALALPSTVTSQINMVPELIRSQLAVIACEANGTTIDVTGVQLQGILDSAYYYEGPLGANVTSDAVSISLWAPTAVQVDLLLWDGPRGGSPQECALTEGKGGVWAHKGPAEWLGKYYTYRVRVYNVWSQSIETFETTDPYSRSLAADGARTQIVDLDDPELQPDGWDTEGPPSTNYQNLVDASIYELHIRDFSISDDTVPKAIRGKYLAFAEDGTAGVKHLRELQEAGMSHVHLLPTYDYGSVPEREEDQKIPEGDLSQFPPDSEEQQKRVWAVAAEDAFNWGYDPVHYGVPEGSYATDPDGSVRILEFRRMVQALHRMGLRVVLDVVYNHTFASGQDGVESKYAVLDRVVPGYYHRRTEAGDLCMSTCCNNTAPEHMMCERLIVDDMVHWTRTYKVDAFRYDIMGHLPLSTMRKVQAALAQLTRESDGVDGSSIYIYGEAWDFGEVSCNQRFQNASQANIGGTSLGSFNDRFRDALLGGSPFASTLYQGWVTGLVTQPNPFMQEEMTATQQRDLLLEYDNLLSLSLAGNLKDYELVTGSGACKHGKQIFYGSQTAGYASHPWETVNYASCHDGETLFDQMIEKAAPEVDLEQRLRMHVLAEALVALGQGIAFFHAGCEILRSKSLDRDSYNSGDWFNRLDWSLQTNNFGVGLPPAAKNKANWHIKRPLLAMSALKPKPEQIRAAKQHFLELLRLRYSTPLLRLPQAEHIKNQLSFHNTGPQQEAGVIIMEVQSADVSGNEGGTTDPRAKRILVVFNARPQSFQGQWPAGVEYLQLHPILQESVDSVVRSATSDPSTRTFSVPGRTAALFVEPC